MHFLSTGSDAIDNVLRPLCQFAILLGNCFLVDFNQQTLYPPVVEVEQKQLKIDEFARLMEINALLKDLLRYGVLDVVSSDLHDQLCGGLGRGE